VRECGEDHAPCRCEITAMKTPFRLIPAFVVLLVASGTDLCGRRILPKQAHAHAHVSVTAGQKHLQTGIGRAGSR
jgi:hypothetical protein